MSITTVLGIAFLVGQFLAYGANDRDEGAFYRRTGIAFICVCISVALTVFTSLAE